MRALGFLGIAVLAAIDHYEATLCVVASGTGTERGCGGGDQDQHQQLPATSLNGSTSAFVKPCFRDVVVTALAVMCNFNFSRVKVLDLTQASRGSDECFHVHN